MWSPIMPASSLLRASDDHRDDGSSVNQSEARQQMRSASRIGATRRYDHLANTIERVGYATRDPCAEYRRNKRRCLQAGREPVRPGFTRPPASQNQPGRSACLKLRHQRR